MLAIPLSALYNGAQLIQRAYTDDLDYSDEWTLIKRKSFYLVNYYDTSLELNEELIDLIPDANAFAIKVFADAFGVELIFDGSPSYYRSLADNCSLGMYGRCENESCGTTCDNHHKSVVAILDQLYNSQRELNHIYILHSDRPETYCKSWVNYHEYHGALGCVDIGKPNILVEYFEGSTKEVKKMFLSIVMVHELAHVFGLYEVNRTEHPTNKQPCVMNEATYLETRTLYSAGNRGNSVFCDYCMGLLSDLLDDIEYIY